MGLENWALELDFKYVFYTADRMYSFTDLIVMEMREEKG